MGNAGVAFLPSSVRNLIQEGALDRFIAEALVPKQLWRKEIIKEKWQAAMGDSQTFTRDGVLPVASRPRTPRVDPVPRELNIEQYTVTADAFGDSVQIDFRQSFFSINGEMARKSRAQTEQAGLSIGRQARNSLFNAYCGGHTWLTAEAAQAQNELKVQSIAGFTQMFNATGKLSAVSGTNTLPIRLQNNNDSFVDVEVTAATPDDANYPNGAGTLVLKTNLAAAHAANRVVLASTRPLIYRIGGGLSSRDIQSGNILTLNAIESLVARMRQLGVPAFPDGDYRCHLSPEAVRQIRRDPDWKAQVESVPEHSRNTGFEVGRISGCTFIENPESPSHYTVDSTENFGPAVTSAETDGQNIARTIIYGQESIKEHYVPELEFIQAQDFAGEIGNWKAVGYTLQSDVEGIRMILRAPMDKFGELMDLTWSWTGGFGIPTDYRARISDGSMYKRAGVIEHADLG